VRSAWRSWFWNVVFFLLMLLMMLIVAGVTVQTADLHQWWAAVGFGLGTAWLAVGTARALFIGVYARPAGIVMRGPFRTTTIPWAEVVEITGGAATSGASGSLGATSAANAKGCIKGAVVGGVAGHYAGHHGVIGAAAGCLIGRHQAKKRAHVQQDIRHADPGRI